MGYKSKGLESGLSETGQPIVVADRLLLWIADRVGLEVDRPSLVVYEVSLQAPRFSFAALR